MTQVVSSISGLQVYAPSAGYAPTNSADVSAIASGYQVVSATSTELYAGTAFLTGVNGAPVSASRAGQAANASMANSAYYDGTGRLISSLPDSAAVSGIASSYAESAASGKQDTLTFDWDADSAISSINGSALAGQGGGASIPFTGYYYDSATSATETITADVTAVSSTAYTKHNGNVVNAYKGITDSNGIHHLGVASFIDAGAEINGKNTVGIPYTMSFAPAVSMWTTADAATGIFAPLQYGTGAGMFMESNNFKGYLKGNEWFVADDRYGYARGEVHNSRGCRVIVEHTGGAVAVLSARGKTANVTLNSTAYGTAKMSVANSQACVQVQRGNSDYKYNSAFLSTDYLKFYNGMATGYLDPEDTASGTAYLSAETEYVYLSSIPYWNAKLDASAIECDTASAITAIGGSSVGGGVDEATVSAIASAYAESSVSAVSGNYYSTSNPSGFITGVDLSDYASTGYVDSSVSGKQDSSAMTAYVDKSAYDELYSSYTGLSALVSQYSGWFNELSSISAKVDNSAIGVV